MYGDEYSVGICGISGSDHTYKRCSTYHNQNLLATREDAESIEALIKLTRLHDEWVGDWKPNYTDPTEKWHIYFFYDVIDIAWTEGIKRFLTFPTNEMASDFLACFKDLIEKAKRFL